MNEKNNMNWFKLIFTSSLAIVFITATLVSLFAATKTANAVFKTYIFKVESCVHEPRPITEEEAAQETDTQKCSVDYNRAKEDIAEGIATMLVAAPFAFVTFRATRKNIEGIKPKDKNQP